MVLLLMVKIFNDPYINGTKTLGADVEVGVSRSTRDQIEQRFYLYIV